MRISVTSFWWWPSHWKTFFIFLLRFAFRLHCTAFITSCLSRFTFLQRVQWENNNGIVLSIFGHHWTCVCVSYDVWYKFLLLFLDRAVNAIRQGEERDLIWGCKKMLPATENPENVHIHHCVCYHSRFFLFWWLICGDSRLNVLFSDMTGCDIL